MGYNKENLKRIRAEYESKSFRAQEEAEARRAELYRAIPEVREMDAHLAGFGLRIMENALKSGETEVDRIHSITLICKITRTDRIRSIIPICKTMRMVSIAATRRIIKATTQIITVMATILRMRDIMKIPLRKKSSPARVLRSLPWCLDLSPLCAMDI